MSDRILRSKVIRLAYQNPSLRPHLLPLLGVRTAMEHSSPEAMKKYLKDHPNADPRNHTVKGDKGEGGKGDKGDKGGSKNPSDVWQSHPAVKKVEEQVQSYQTEFADAKKGAETAISSAKKKEENPIFDDEDAYIGDKLDAAVEVVKAYESALKKLESVSDVSEKTNSYFRYRMDTGSAAKDLGSSAGAGPESLKVMKEWSASKRQVRDDMEKEADKYRGRASELKKGIERFKEKAEEYARKGDLGKVRW